MATPSPEEFEVQGKVALVTGAASGIGFSITRCLLKKGAKVSMLDINKEAGERALKHFQKKHKENVVFMVVDVTVKEQLVKAFTKTKEWFNGLDIVCNNAGVANEVDWRKLVETNMMAMIEGVHLAIHHMSTRNGGQGGVVINTASVAGYVPNPYAPTYCATKHAIVGYTRCKKDLAKSDGIRVNCICPGMVNTAMVKDMFTDQSPLSKEVQEYVKATMLSADQVAVGVLKLILDTSKAGAIMALTSEYGATFPELPSMPQ
ncbi:15-hydroxyprostaglandin dehydrogenase [NAD(+)]-like [Halichondria panicea]|uniref:15-hydroxyprostaglandin dehydrogenase [NAD(+)]-like n=1 Tax=Halichondria panicea TaxID=6063 RepID=UPI00312B66CB